MQDNIRELPAMVELAAEIEVPELKLVYMTSFHPSLDGQTLWGQEDMLKDTWIIVTSDHGEEFFEHGGFEHGHRYEEEVTRIPCIIRPPGAKWFAGKRVERTARHVDLFSTLLTIFNKTIPPNIEGRELLSMIDGRDTLPRPAYMSNNLYGPPRRAFFDRRFKLVQFLGVDDAYLYDLRDDPEEKQPYNNKHPVFPVLKRNLESYEKKYFSTPFVPNGQKDTPEIPMDESVKKSLKALGYIQ